MFIGRTDTKVQLLWSPAEKSQLIGKDPDAGKDRRREEKGTTEDEMVGWRRRLDGRECEQAPGDGEGQGHGECCRLWGREQSGTTERLASSGDSGCGRVSLVFIRISLLLRLVPLPRQIEPGARPPVCEQQYACYGLRPLFNVGCSLWENPNAIFLQPHGLPGGSRVDMRLFRASEWPTGALLGAQSVGRGEGLGTCFSLQRWVAVWTREAQVGV